VTAAIAAVGIVPHRDRPLAHTLAQAAAAWFADQGVEVRVPGPEAEAASLTHYATAVEKFADGLDLVIAVGGDGTMLHAVQLVFPARAPLVGVNVGQLGYLTELEPSELEASLPRLLRGEFQINERMMLDAQITSDGAARGTWYALNEVVLEKQRSGHLIRLDVSINGTPFTTYAADGAIVATPTGSTAYSFSARGPIVSPAQRGLLLTPVSPHMLFDRSLMLGADEELDFVVCDGRHVVVTVDGRELGELDPGDRVRFRAAAEPLQLVSLRPRDFHRILKTKFALPDR
jgi:NAD+ kinase